MPGPIKKIEDILDKVTANLQYNPETPHQTDPNMGMPDKAELSFPQLLDFSFPETVDESQVAQVGEVVYVGDGVVRVTGLEKTTIEEIIEIQTKKGVEKALILGIQETFLEAVVLGDYTAIKRGDAARSTGSSLTVPVGEGMIGRVINPMGVPIDGKGSIKSSERRLVEFPAPSVMDRMPIYQPLHTGIAVIDSIIPIGKGQRELVIGDRKTGKSRTLIDIICNQKSNNIACVYVGVSLQAAKAKSTLQLLEERGALKYTTLVIALANEPPSLQYISPYVGAAIAEYFMYQGKDALIIYDDLSKQAKAYRQVSLLLKRSPGRDAYPGDIFFLHSRLLERASKLSNKLGEGSMTALPVAETQGGDVSDYIITNLMSITDGHIYLDANLMHEGVLPAVDSATSVSRIGGKVQTNLLKKTGELTSRILARYNEVKSFETINTEVAEDTIRDIKRGKRMKEILSQDSALNLSTDEEAVLLGIATSSRMDHLEMEHVITFKKNIIPYYRDTKKADMQKPLDDAKGMDEVDDELDNLFNSFCRKFQLPLLEQENTLKQLETKK